MDPFEVIVECYAGYRADETPRRLSIWGKDVEVSEVLDRWLAPEHRYFKVRGSDNHIYILRNDTAADRWELTMYQKG